MKLLLVDNYDSFTWNLRDLLATAAARAGQPAEIVVVRNDASDLAGLAALRPDAVVLSPGPNAPEQAGICLDLLRQWGGRLPMFGVCLGQQALAVACGGRVVRAPAPVHGKPSLIGHDGRGVLAGLPQPFAAMRYHSLVVDPERLPAELEVSAWLAAEAHLPLSGRLIMGLRHRTWPIEAVQFHPESVGTPCGPQLADHVVRWLAAQVRAMARDDE